MSEDKIHVRHILVKHQYEAEDLERKLNQGADFAELAKKFSICSSAAAGGDLGVVSLKRLDSDFSDVATSLKKKAVSKPFRTKFGFHIVQRLD